MNFKIDPNSSTPFYKQIVNAIKNGTTDGSIRNGEKLPSLQEFAEKMGVSKETTKNAYNLLKKENLISGKQGKGYFIDIKETGAPKRVIMFLDSLSEYKLRIINGAASRFNGQADITIQVFNHDINLLEKMVNEALGSYDWYMVTPHFHPGVESSRISRCLKKFPNDRFILLDRDLPALKGRFGRIFQDFHSDTGKALGSNISYFRKYSNIVIIASETSLYAGEIIPSIIEALKKELPSINVSNAFRKEMMKAGTAFIVIDSKIDQNLFSILRESSEQGYSLGKEIGLVSFNDEPVNEFICGGLTCLSTDFDQMGRSAAEMVISSELKTIHNPFSLVLRNSL